MAFSLKKTASASSLCAVLLLAACTSQTESAGPTSSPTASPSSSSATASPSPLPSETSAAPSAEPSSAEASSQPAEPSASPQPTVLEEAPVLVAAGTSCGLSNTGRTSLVVAEGSVSCAEVQQVFADFNAQFTGSSQQVDINGYLCRSYSTLESQFMGRTVTCKGQGKRLEAMTDYHVGGIPIDDALPHMSVSLTGHFALIAQAHGVSCNFGEGQGVLCVGPQAGANTFQTITFAQDGSLSLDVSKQHLPSHDNITNLPVGYSINTQVGSCLNDGTYLVCSNGVSSFKMNSSEFIEL